MNEDWGVLNSIEELQNDEQSIGYLRAAAAMHVSARRLIIISASISLLSCALAILSSAKVVPTVFSTFAGFFSGLAVLILSYPLKSRLRRAANIQDAFDRRVFGIPNQRARTKVIEDVASYSPKFKGNVSSLTSWYEGIDTRLPTPYGAIIAQWQAMNWDGRLRSAWILILATLAAIWLGIGILIGLVFGWSLANYFVVWLFPSVGFIVFLVTVLDRHIRAHLERAKCARSCLRSLSGAQTVYGSAAEPRWTDLSENVVRNQEKILSARTQAERVPDGLYKRLKSGHSTEVAAVTDAVTRRVLGEL